MSIYELQPPFLEDHVMAVVLEMARATIAIDHGVASDAQGEKPGIYVLPLRSVMDSVEQPHTVKTAVKWKTRLLLLLLLRRRRRLRLASCISDKPREVRIFGGPEPRAASAAFVAAAVLLVRRAVAAMPLGILGAERLLRQRGLQPRACPARSRPPWSRAAGTAMGHGRPGALRQLLRSSSSCGPAAPMVLPPPPRSRARGLLAAGSGSWRPRDRPRSVELPPGPVRRRRRGRPRAAERRQRLPARGVRGTLAGGPAAPR
mmetsp:Transcript_16633/g.52040  ORF Transcript_16633/g.52040 Transcript_16633/m.52040 type:complete len:260 (-) Transcript_16633:386-1165(-)